MKDYFFDKIKRQALDHRCYYFFCKILVPLLVYLVEEYPK